MKKVPWLVGWTAANALGLGMSFLAMMQLTMLIQYGFEFERHWVFVPPGQGAQEYIARLVASLVGGVIFGAAQALALRSRPVRGASWLLATVSGFALVLAVEWPLLAIGIWGRIPGPAEPILITVGGGSFAGVLQYLALRRQGVVASKWLIRWVGGLVAGLVPTSLLFMSLSGAEVPVSWPMEVFLSGFVVAGMAGLCSGRALLAAISPASGAASWRNARVAGHVR